MLVPRRHSSDDYRYGFQGQEKDDEIKGDGNSLNYTFRMHDPRVGRFFARDPLAPKYPFYSPYAFSGNRVIDMVELEGLEPAEAPTSEGQRANAIDQKAVKNNDYYLSDLFGWMTGNTKDNKLYKTWVGHMGTSGPVWYEESNYKQMIMPFAISFAQFQGWAYGTDWQSARDLICNPGEPSDILSPETSAFLSSRVLDSNYLDYLTQIGAHEINSANKAMYSSATGAITPMDLDSPFFGVGFGLKAFATGGKSIDLYRAVSQEELIDVSVNGFRSAESGYQSEKLFTTSAENASNFGKLFYPYDKKPFFILKTSVQTKFESQLFRTEMDLMPGIAVPESLFSKLSKTTVIDCMPMPNHPWIKN